MPPLHQLPCHMSYRAKVSWPAMASTARTTRNRQRRANRREPRLFPDFQPVSCRPVCRLPGAVCDADSAEWWCGDPFCFSVAEIRSLKWWSCLTSRSLVVDLPLKRGTRLDQNDHFCTPRKKRPGLSRRQSLTAAERLGMLLFSFQVRWFHSSNNHFLHHQKPLSRSIAVTSATTFPWSRTQRRKMSRPREPMSAIEVRG